MNEFQYQLERANRARDKILRPFYKEHSRDGEFVCIDGKSLMCKILQRIGGDTMLTITSGDLVSIQEKMRWIVRDDILIETDSCTVPGYEKPGWGYTISDAVNVVLYCMLHGDENGALCFPLPWPATRIWFDQHKGEFREQMVENRINGFCLWTRNLIVPRRQIVKALRIEAFQLRDGRVVQDFLGNPQMEWLQ